MLNYLSSNHALIAAFAPRPARRTRHETLSLNRVFRQAPKLSDYFEAAEIVALKGGLERPISGLAIDSRRVVPGNLFFAISGLRSAPANSVDEAISRGAVAVVTEIMPGGDLLEELINRGHFPEVRARAVPPAAGGRQG